MADLWYYSHDEGRIGPLSSQRMRQLAACGQIKRTDTVWKEGVVQGVTASKVKHLFLVIPEVGVLIPIDAPAAFLPAEAVTPVVVVIEAVKPADLPTPPPAKQYTATSNVPTEQPRRARATAGKGAVLVGQDGVNVKCRKKCTKCGHTDTSWTTIPIRSGVMRIGFFCPKCRKHRDVEIFGSLN